MVYGRRQMDFETKKQGIMYVVIFLMVIFLRSTISFWIMKIFLVCYILVLLMKQN